MSTKHIVKWVVLAAGIFGAYGAFQKPPLEDFFQPGRIQAFLQGMGPLAPVCFIGLMALAVVVSPIPSLPLDLAAGAVFGPLWGGGYAVLGAEFGAIISFMIGRAVGREALSRWLNVEVSFCQKCSDHHLMVLVFFARLLPIFSFDIVSYGAGLTRMSLKVFAVSTFLGMIPPTFVLTYLGGSVATTEWPFILSAMVFAGLLLVMPKLLLRNRGAWWVRLIQGNAPDPGALSAKGVPMSPGRCEWCGDIHGPGRTSDQDDGVR